MSYGSNSNKNSDTIEMTVLNPVQTITNGTHTLTTNHVVDGNSSETLTVSLDSVTEPKTLSITLGSDASDLQTMLFNMIKSGIQTIMQASTPSSSSMFSSQVGTTDLEAEYNKLNTLEKAFAADQITDFSIFPKNLIKKTTIENWFGDHSGCKLRIYCPKDQIGVIGVELVVPSVQAEETKEEEGDASHEGREAFLIPIPRQEGTGHTIGAKRAFYDSYIQPIATGQRHGLNAYTTFHKLKAASIIMEESKEEVASDNAILQAIEAACHDDCQPEVITPNEVFPSDKLAEALIAFYKAVDSTKGAAYEENRKEKRAEAKNLSYEERSFRK